jgi:hypothetical protein
LFQKGQGTREELLFFPVGTDQLACLLPAALDFQVSPVLGIRQAPAGINRWCSSHSAYLSDNMLRLCALQIDPAQRMRAHVVLHHPPGYTGGYCHPADTDVAASALHALRLAASTTSQGVPPPSWSSEMCPVSLQPTLPPPSAWLWDMSSLQPKMASLLPKLADGNGQSILRPNSEGLRGLNSEGPATRATRCAGRNRCSTATSLQRQYPSHLSESSILVINPSHLSESSTC